MRIEKLEVYDVRFPTSAELDGSDAMHTSPDYSCAYVVLQTGGKHRGCGLTFTIGEGTEIVVAGIKALEKLVVGKKVDDIFNDFAAFWKSLTCHSQLRWIGPEKGVIHMSTAAIINALWDLWAKIEEKPVWKLLTDMEPEKLVSTIDFTYITDVLTRDEAVAILKEKRETVGERLAEIEKTGYPAYTTQAGWLGYPTEKMRRLCREALAQGFKGFKIKVGQNVEDDIERCEEIRKIIGYENDLMLDANQKWEVGEAVCWTKRLSAYRPVWIEEPTSPDDVLGHLAIAEQLRPLGIGVAGGEMCSNRVMFKQFLRARALDYCQIDAARVGGVNELLSIYLMANKLDVKVCPHGGGVGLCEMVQHLQIWDYLAVSGSLRDRSVEYVDRLHQVFMSPPVLNNAHYQLPKDPGYSTEMRASSIEEYSYPDGTFWRRFIADREMK